MTYAILGGTFDPVHIGHLVLAQEVREEFGYDRVLLVPANIPPHKEAGTHVGGATAAQRLRMLERSVADLEGIEVEDCELRRGGVSYTVDTLEHLSGRGDTRGVPGLVLGDDLAQGFSTWKDPGRVATSSDLILAHRDRIEEITFPYRHRYAHNILIRVSSTVLRSRIRAGLPVGLLVPAGTLEYIREHGLYGATARTR